MILFGMIISFTTIWEAKKFGGSIFNFIFQFVLVCIFTFEASLFEL